MWHCLAYLWPVLDKFLQLGLDCNLLSSFAPFFPMNPPHPMLMIYQGGVSDRGYNSMTAEDVKRMSQMVISAEDSETASSPATSACSDASDSNSNAKGKGEGWREFFGSLTHGVRDRSGSGKHKKGIHHHSALTCHRFNMFWRYIYAEMSFSLPFPYHDDLIDFRYFSSFVFPYMSAEIISHVCLS